MNVFDVVGDSSPKHAYYIILGDTSTRTITETLQATRTGTVYRSCFASCCGFWRRNARVEV